MNLRDRELIDRLAAEFVLGTLRGGARRRFERLARERADVRAAIHEWERRLMPLAEAIEPVVPPQRVWQGIEQRLFADRQAAGVSAGQAGAGAVAGVWHRLWHSLAFWRWLTAASAVATVLLAVLVVTASGRPEFAARVAVLQDTGGQTMLLLQIDQPRQGAAMVKAALGSLKPPAIPADRALELWAVPGSGAPKSLGVLPAAGAGRLSLPAEALAPEAVLAVSVEPIGGSPTGAPTGPVILQGRVSAL